MENRVVIMYRPRCSREYVSYEFVGSDNEINHELARWYSLGYVVNVEAL